MRIAMVSEHASPLAALGGEDAGGQNVHVAALAAGLVEHGASVTVHTRRDDRGLHRQVTMVPGVTVDHVPAGPPRPIPKDELFPYMDEFAGRLHRQWRKQRPDVVHSHFWMSGHAAVKAARPLGIPVLHTFHALGVVKRREQGCADTSPPERIGVETRLLADADRILATCPDEVFELLRLGASRRKLSVIPCGVDTGHYTPDGPSENSTRPRLLYVGRLVQRKGIGSAITALAEVPDAELVIAGGPAPGGLGTDPDVARLRAIADKSGVADRVEFRGRVDRDRLPELYRSADVVVSVPWYEPFGIVPLEAMACGVPVVATAVGGLADSVIDQVTGVHVPPRSPGQMAAAIRRLLSDEGLRADFGRAGRDRATAHYAMDRVITSTLRAYASTLLPTQRRLRA